jgi:hypothetical protein
MVFTDVTVVFPLIGVSIVWRKFYVNFVIKVQKYPEDVCGRRSPLFRFVHYVGHRSWHAGQWCFPLLRVSPAYNSTTLNPLLISTWVKPEMLGLTEQVESTNFNCTTNYRLKTERPFFKTKSSGFSSLVVKVLYFKPISNPGCGKLTLSPWERHFTRIFSLHPSVKRVPSHRSVESLVSTLVF